MSTAQTAWIGRKADVEECLHLVQADVERATQQYRVETPSRFGLSFLGCRDQMLITSRVQFFIQGEPHSLLLLLRRAGAKAILPIAVHPAL